MKARVSQRKEKPQDITIVKDEVWRVLLRMKGFNGGRWRGRGGQRRAEKGSFLKPWHLGGAYRITLIRNRQAKYTRTPLRMMVGWWWERGRGRVPYSYSTVYGSSSRILPNDMTCKSPKLGFCANVVFLPSLGESREIPLKGYVTWILPP